MIDQTELKRLPSPLLDRLEQKKMKDGRRMEIQKSQAADFMSKVKVIRDELTAAGALVNNGVWTFPDGSVGRFLSFEGRFIAIDTEKATDK